MYKRENMQIIGGINLIRYIATDTGAIKTIILNDFILINLTT